MGKRMEKILLNVWSWIHVTYVCVFANQAISGILREQTKWFYEFNARSGDWYLSQYVLDSAGLEIIEKLDQMYTNAFLKLLSASMFLEVEKCTHRYYVMFRVIFLGTRIEKMFTIINYVRSSLRNGIFYTWDTIIRICWY